MDTNLLPIELLEKVIYYLDNKSIINLISTNKYYNRLDNDFFWKQKCKKEYNYTLVFKRSSKRIDWKLKYSQLYKKNCVHCYKKTKSHNEFFNVKICRKCEKENSKYHMISYIKATKDYFLTKSDLSNLKFINRNNPFNSSRQLKLFLKTDIIEYIKQHYGYYHYNDFRDSKISERARRSIESLNKFHILVIILTNSFNMTTNDILNILHDINKYSNNLYNRYIRYNNTDVVPQLIEKCIELHFIYKYTTLDWQEFDNFQELLLFFLLTSKTVVPLDINHYINNSISYCIILHQEKFKRKNELLSLIHQEPFFNNENTKYILEIPIMYEYIYNGSHSENINEYVLTYDEYIYYESYSENSLSPNIKILNRIVKLLILEEFLYTFTGISSVILNNIVNGTSFDKFRLSKQLLNKWYNNNKNDRHLLPSALYEFLYTSCC